MSTKLDQSIFSQLLPQFSNIRSLKFYSFNYNYIYSLCIYLIYFFTTPQHIILFFCKSSYSFKYNEVTTTIKYSYWYIWWILLLVYRGWQTLSQQGTCDFLIRRGTPLLWGLVHTNIKIHIWYLKRCQNEISKPRFWEVKMNLGIQKLFLNLND